MANAQPAIKQLIDLRVKDASKGEVEAVVATIGVVDRDGDVILPGAIEDGARVKMSAYGHDMVIDRKAPVGKGTINIEGNKAIFRGRLFLGTERGRETFEVLRGMGRDQEWSFGFHVAKSLEPDEEWRERGARALLAKLVPLEASPVIEGAGIDTMTVAVKSAAALDPEQAEAAALCRRLKARDAEMRGPGPARPLPDRFRPFVDWGAARYALAPSEVPEIKIVSGFRLDAHEAGAWGLYHRPRGEIWVRAGLGDEETRAVIVHELCHVYEDRKGWGFDEGFAYSQERKLLERWRDEQRWSA